MIKRSTKQKQNYFNQVTYNLLFEKSEVEASQFCFLKRFVWHNLNKLIRLKQF